MTYPEGVYCRTCGAHRVMRPGARCSLCKGIDRQYWRGVLLVLLLLVLLLWALA